MVLTAQWIPLLYLDHYKHVHQSCVIYSITTAFFKVEQTRLLKNENSEEGTGLLDKVTHCRSRYTARLRLSQAARAAVTLI